MDKQNKLPLKLIDRLKINTYAYLLSSTYKDRNERNDLVNNYELATYKNRVHEYCFKNAAKCIIDKDYASYRQFLIDYYKCSEKYGCGCS